MKMADYEKMWEDLGMDVKNHDNLCQVLPTADVYKRQMLCNFQFGTARGVPVIRIRFVPSGTTDTPSLIRCSSSSARRLHIWAQRTGSSKKEIWVMSRACLLYTSSDHRRIQGSDE